MFGLEKCEKVILKMCKGVFVLENLAWSSKNNTKS